MGYHPRFEVADQGNLVTTNTKHAELWFANNPTLERALLARTAKYSTRYDVRLYALSPEGNHAHLVAEFPGCNRADFMRDLNSTVAREASRCTATFTGGNLWARRYSNEFLPAPEDIEDKFFYTVLQPVQDGLVEQLSKYPFYNCFSDAVRGITRTFKIVRWAEYNAARKRNRKTAIADYTDIVHLKYQRLPGYEHLSQREYSKLMHQKLEERRRKIVAARKAEGKGFLGVQKLLRIVTGSKPQNTKQTGARLQKRPRVLSVCSIRKQNGLSWYFSRFVQYKSASRQYRAGNLEAEFPEGTYKPYVRARAGAPPG